MPAPAVPNPLDLVSLAPVTHQPVIAIQWGHKATTLNPLLDSTGFSPLLFPRLATEDVSHSSFSGLFLNCWTEIVTCIPMKVLFSGHFFIYLHWIPLLCDQQQLPLSSFRAYIFTKHTLLPFCNTRRLARKGSTARHINWSSPSAIHPSAIQPHLSRPAGSWQATHASHCSGGESQKRLSRAPYRQTGTYHHLGSQLLPASAATGTLNKA